MTVRRYCENCNKVFETTIRNKKYCSKSCALKVEYKQRNTGLRPSERFSILERDGFRCHYCGKSPHIHAIVLVVDHIVPISNGLENDVMENLIASCEECNVGKGYKSIAHNLVEFLKTKSG